MFFFFSFDSRELCRDHASILFCTTGMLLQFLHGNPALTDWSHLILDEIHERSTESDFIITLLKQIIPRVIISMFFFFNDKRTSFFNNNYTNYFRDLT